ncbi:MAG: hypothetical protein ACYC2G_01505 [Gemmatimonadaceae bacterium]
MDGRAGAGRQMAADEVSVIVRRGNYGWHVRDGTRCFGAEYPVVSPPTRPGIEPTTGEPLRDPVIEPANGKHGGLALTVVGGHVYGGRDVRSLRGR